ncbi:MAG: chromosome segregation protein SMC, partial [Methylophilaceae bacterium]|nr:chromosome segregation protein SMC [Methylophilaceae bacterium]
MHKPNWSYPGSRWWKFDFHTHTPASTDTRAWQQAIGSAQEVTAEKWLLKYMTAGIDCVAVTDHNSGAWIDTLKLAYASMKTQADAGQAPEGFRELFLFPGVEISVNGGVHLLAIFDTNATTRTMTDLLAQVEYQGTDGDSDGVTKKSAEEVIRQVLQAGGIPIPAHADKEKGLFALDSNTLKQVLAVEGLLAVEWCAAGTPTYPQAVQKLAQPLAWVLG